MKLFHKWLFVIGFPVLIELLFIPILAVLLVNYDEEVRAQRDAHAINLKLHDLSFLGSETGLIMAEYGVSLSPELKIKVERNFMLMNEELDKLRHMVGRSELLDGIERLQVDWTNSFELARELQALADKNERVDEPTQLVLALRVREALGIVTDNEKILLARQSAELERLAEERDASKLVVIICVATLFLANLAIPIALKVFVTDDIVNRIRRMHENSLRLATYKNWAPSTDSANDEIGILDKTFQEMADKLNDSLDRESAIFKNTIDILCALDANQRIIRANQAWEKILGFDTREVLETHLVQYIEERHRQSMSQLFLTAQESAGRTQQLTVTLKSAAGEPLIMHWSVSWEPAEKLFFCVARDVTEIDRLERAKQRFRRMLGEDLRKPLVSTKAAFDRMVRGEYGGLAGNMFSILSRAKLSVDRLILLVDELLDLDKLESGRISLTKSRLKLAEVFKSAVDALSGVAEASKITIEVGSSDVEITADREALVRVVINLLSNAIKFSPAQSTVSVVASQSGGTVEIRVVDQGKGISEDFLPQVFERFKQANRTDRTVKQGSGLGLAICKTIVEAHGGTIGVTSKVGQGSCFWFQIPVS